MLKFKQRCLRIQNVGLCLIRKWWRPVMLAGVAAATWVNLVFLPLIKGEFPDLQQAALWIAACGALQWVREWGKVKGVAASE